MAAERSAVQIGAGEATVERLRPDGASQSKWFRIHGQHPARPCSARTSESAAAILSSIAQPRRLLSDASSLPVSTRYAGCRKFQRRWGVALPRYHPIPISCATSPGYSSRRNF